MMGGWAGLRNAKSERRTPKKTRTNLERVWEAHRARQRKGRAQDSPIIGVLR